MKQVSSEKHDTAWFKLAECIARREHERALGLYRLLSHSLNDRALAQQLAGDLALAFEDQTTALERYAQAAQLYQHEKQIHEAIAVYKHILVIDPSCQQSKLQLLELVSDKK